MRIVMPNDNNSNDNSKNNEKKKNKKKNRHPEREKKTWNSLGHFDSFDSC